MRGWGIRVVALFVAGSFQLESQSRVTSFSFGGSGTDSVQAIAVDRDGYIYLAGYTNSKDLPAHDRAFQTQPHGYDAFVAKLTPEGEPVWTTYLGGNDARTPAKAPVGDVPTAIDVDAEGNVYVAGSTASTDFPVVNAIQSQPQAPARLPGSAYDGFVAKLSRDGDRLVYSTYLGAPDGVSRVAGLRAGASGEVWLLVTTGAASFDASRDLSTDGSTIVMKLNRDGSRAWASRIGGSEDTGTAIAVDEDGRPIVAGRGTPMRCAASLSCSSAFVTKLDASGASVVFSTTIGGKRSVWVNGTALTSATGVALGRDGRTVVAGTTTAADLPVVNAWQPAPGGEGDAFLGVLSSSGEIDMLTYIGGNGADGGTTPRLAIDASGAVHIAIDTMSTDLPAQGAIASRHPDGPFFRSFDGADSWESSGFGASGSVKTIAIDPNGGGVYAATSLGILRSVDDGASWTPANEGLMVPDGTINQRIGPVDALAIDPRQPNVLYAGARGGLYRWDDGAGSWRQLRAAGMGVGGFWPRFIGVSPHDGSVWVAPGNGIEVSPDGGTTWERRDRGLPMTIVGTVATPEAIVFDPRRPGVVYAASSFGLFATEDNGDSWQLLTGNIVEYPGGLPSQQTVVTVALDPFDPSVIYAGTFNRGILKTTDRGATWSRILTFTSVRSIAIDPESRDTIYVSSRGSSVVPGKVLRSHDGGETWSSADVGLTMRGTPSQILIDPRDRSRLYTGTENLSFAPFVARLDALGDAPAFASYLPEGSVRDVAVEPDGDTVVALMSSSAPSRIVITRIGR